MPSDPGILRDEGLGPDRVQRFCHFSLYSFLLYKLEGLQFLPHQGLEDLMLSMWHGKPSGHRSLTLTIRELADSVSIGANGVSLFNR